MPRRNVKINSEQVYWVRREGSDKGFSIYSKEQLDRWIEEGKIKENDRVQLRVSKGV